MCNPPLALDGSFNFRDLGGFVTRDARRVRRGLVYRSDALHRLEPGDIKILDGLGIKKVFDLRSSVELERDGLGEFARLGGRHVHVPLISVSLSPFDPEVNWRQLNLQDRYLEMLESGGDAIRRILLEIAAPDFAPLVFHCTGGKDRTGVVAAVLLRALGVSEDDVLADYSLSERYLKPVIHRYRAVLKAGGLDDDAIDYLTRSPPERMARTLAELDRRWGSVESYLESLGLDKDSLRELKMNMLD
ncbi:MAG: tyrosine-protein phosphatase [Candidatus Binatia bacterium]